MPSTIRINVTPELLKILKYLKEKKFALLDNAEIIRAVLSDYYVWCKKMEKEGKPIGYCE